MGSIVAVIGNSTAPALAGRMLAAAPYRGTRRRWVGLGKCALGFSASEAFADADMATADGCAAVFVGTLDNAKELAKELAVGEASAVEVVLAAFRRLGEGAPAKFRGAFAAAITDGTRLWCFRDQIGLCSLEYRHDACTLAVASEPIQLEPTAPSGLQPDLEGLEALFYKYCDGRAAVFTGVRRLPAATILSADGDSVGLRRYWDPEHLIETARLSDADLAEAFHAHMSRAVARVMSGSDVVALSGGIDSTAVAAYAAPLHRAKWGRPLGALSAIYPNQPAVDESRYTRLVAASLDIPLHMFESVPAPTDRLDYWVGLTRSPVHPQFTISETEELYRQAHALGYATILTGEFAEAVVEMRQGLFAHLLRRGQVSTLLRHLRGYRSNGAGALSLAKGVAVAAFPALRSVSRRLRGDRLRVPRWLDADRVREALHTLQATRPTWRNAQMPVFEGANLVGSADEVCQDVCGVRVRVPWADVDLWEFFLSLPAEVKFPDVQPKALVRRLLRGQVPDEILDRRDKTYFDDFIRANIDYAALRRWLVNPKHRLPSVDYDALAGRLQSEDLDLTEFLWAKDLASIHAFLALW